MKEGHMSGGIGKKGDLVLNTDGAREIQALVCKVGNQWPSHSESASQLQGPELLLLRFPMPSVAAESRGRDLV